VKRIRIEMFALQQILFTPEIDAKFRVATWHGFAVYGAVPDASNTVYGEDSVDSSHEMIPSFRMSW
jgi:hypothetical protein